MRTTLLGSLLDVAQSNLARDAERVALFESGRVYLTLPPTGLNRTHIDRNRPIDLGWPGDSPGSWRPRSASRTGLAASPWGR